MSWIIINILIYFFFIFIEFFVLFIVRIYIFFLNIRVIIEWSFFRVRSLRINIFILLDWVSVLFVRLVFLISSIIFFYRKIYIEGDKIVDRFNILVFLFIISIILIVIRPRIFSILFGWDGLGLISYCLVIYYQNYLSYNSGIVTVLFNRVGDVALLVSIGLIFVYGSWSQWVMDRYIIVLFLVLAAITKRAQVPFRVWLPKAIAAPTPVSALVHSSTLVTAGVYILIRYNKVLVGRGCRWIVLFISIFTRFISGLIAYFEYDLKKIIALSTLRQLGVIFLSLRIGQEIVSFFHLLMHAIFKSILFIGAGIIIHFSIGNQDIRGFGGLNNFCPFLIVRFYVSIFSLCGFPFISGFYSKDLIIELVYLYSVRWVLIIINIFSLTLTVIYSFRLVRYRFFGRMKVRVYRRRVGDNLIISISIIILIILRMVTGRIIRWLFFFDLVIPYIIIEIKIITLISCLFGLILRILSNKLVKKLEKVIVRFFRTMCFLEFLRRGLRKIILVRGRWGLDIDKTWIEYSGWIVFKEIRLSLWNNLELKLRFFIFINLIMIYFLLLYFIL